jgi:glycosyltransferase involved in cell wall biosynthesis
MDSSMPKKISYFLHDFTPDREALSKETEVLYSHFDSYRVFQVAVHDISTKFKMRFSKSMVCYPDWMLPLGYFFTRHLQNHSDLIHIVGSVTGRIYLKILNRKPTILTNASAIIMDRVENCKGYWPKLDKIVVECNRDKKILLECGVPPERLQLIYPGVQLPEVTRPKIGKKFKILFASAPISDASEEFSSKGVDLILKVAAELKDCDFTLLWRKKHLDRIKDQISTLKLKNVILQDEIISDVMQFFEQSHAIILVPIKEDACKPCPHSIVEALAVGRPVIVSRFVGIADIIQQEECGVVCDGEKESLITAIERLRASYSVYQRRCRVTAREKGMVKPIDKRRSAHSPQIFFYKKIVRAYENLSKKLGIIEQ